MEDPLAFHAVMQVDPCDVAGCHGDCVKHDAPDCRDKQLLIYIMAVLLTHCFLIVGRDSGSVKSRHIHDAWGVIKQSCVVLPGFSCAPCW